QQSEIGEEHVDVPAVGRRGGPGRAVPAVELFQAGAGSLALPEDSSGTAIEADRDEPLAPRGGQENTIVRQCRRGVAEWQLRFPDDVAVGAKLGRDTSAGGDARSVRTAEARPVFRVRRVRRRSSVQ